MILDVAQEVSSSESSETYHTRFEIWGFSIKNIHRFESLFDHTDCAIEETHQMAMGESVDKIQTIRRGGGITATEVSVMECINESASAYCKRT